MKKILVIDDDADIREIVKTILEDSYELREAASRGEGTAALQEFAPDLVVLDVMMERHDSGFELAREIKAAGAGPKILMLTNVDNEMNMDFKSTAGDPDWLPVDDYLVKPVTASEFLPKVEALLGE